MHHTDNNKHIGYMFNKDCNWNCAYCNQRNCDKTHVDEKVLFERFTSTLTYILENCDNEIWLHLVGGEPGLWSENLWNKIILFVNDNLRIESVTVYSNGTIFKHPLFQTNKSCFKVSWHCSEKLNTKIKYPFDINAPSTGYIINKTVFPIVVLTKDNYTELPKFLELNPELPSLQVVLCSSSKLMTYESIFTKQDLIHIRSILVQHSDKILADSIFEVNVYLSKFDNRAEIYSICKKQVNKLTIDLAQKLIYHCCYYKHFVPLTNDNLLVKQKNIDCTGCFNPSMYYQELMDGN